MVQAGQPDPREPEFAHPSEREFARILDFYGVAWQYEPRSFVLSEEDGRVTEMFTPDFYLPDLDQYVELTTLRQRLVTRKNRKLRRLQERYPEINVRLLYKRDYYELLAKYGFHAGELDLPRFDELLRDADRILFSQRQVRLAVERLAADLTRDYAARDPLLVGVLKGVSFFLSDLARAMPIPLELGFMAVSELGAVGGGGVRILLDLERDIRGRDVVLIEDIVDTGLTLHYLLSHLAAHQPASLEVCALLDKRPRRLVESSIRYVGFEVGDDFLVGYGLDFQRRYRNLPFISVLKPEAYRADRAPGASAARAPSESASGGAEADTVH
jgi:hypoxanthine phosphoribosyltransferase